MKILFGLFLIAHGLLHLSYLSPEPPDSKVKWPFVLDHSWLLSGLGISDSLVCAAGSLLCVVTAAAFGVAALGVFGVFDGWRTVAAVGAASGLMLLVLYWHVWLVVGVGLNAVILAAMLFTDWTP